jgi:peroxiredoxin
MCHLQELYVQCKEKGLVVLGFNWADDKKIALDFLAENGATFPTILDSSDAGEKVQFQDYRASGVPLNYVIGRDGKIVDAWYGSEPGHSRARAVLEKVGIKAPQKTAASAKGTLLERLSRSLCPSP